MSFFKEFKEFAMRGNVIDLAVGVVIGGAFGKIVDSLVKDVIMPPIGWLMGGVDFSGLKFNLPAILEGQPAVTINYGSFIQTMVNFIIIAFAIFLLIKGLNKVSRKKEEAAPAGPSQEELLTQIRDLLAQQKH
ncbi:large-conductance mechanosensitive channel protein MscL [Thiolinea disciformis]|uniref:large-conductance mechanosensitive channel protein MscL n=1 Tax=Thiolinea disciformis TaxID=125614 RepID=UPI00035F3BC5|nr:large-conductance mechanosensitive channel protein MscL [Thiolinea disciformis]